MESGVLIQKGFHEIQWQWWCLPGEKKLWTEIRYHCLSSLFWVLQPHGWREGFLIPWEGERGELQECNCSCCHWVKKKKKKICVTDCCCGQACLYHSSYHPRHPGPACRAAAAWIYGSQQSKEGSVASVVNNLLVSTIYPLLGLAERSCACEILHCPHAFVSSLTFPGEHSISWGGGPLGGLVRSQRVCGPWTWHFHWWTTGVKTASEKVCSTLTKFSLSHFLHFLDVW